MTSAGDLWYNLGVVVENHKKCNMENREDANNPEIQEEGADPSTLIPNQNQGIDNELDQDIDLYELLNEFHDPNPPTQALVTNPTHVSILAQWPPKRESRAYYWANGTEISPKSYPTKSGKPDDRPSPIGAELPSNGLLSLLKQLEENKSINQHFYQPLLKTSLFFTNLPAAFWAAYLSVQYSSGKPILSFPTLGKNKNRTVIECIADTPAYKEGLLHISNWQTLGWNSEDEYNKWLKTTVQFAFTHCCPYLSVPRIFDVDKNKSPKDKVHFKQVFKDLDHVIQKKHKLTHIFSVKGFEYRRFEGNWAETLAQVQEHSRLTMLHILTTAEKTDTTDIVWIPYGMGVFIRNLLCEEEVKKATFAGMREALASYKGKYVTLHCCAFLEKLTNGINNPSINFQDKTGLDAYTIANDIQDRGDDLGEREKLPNNTGNPRKLKAMLINAADDDWTAALDPDAIPGQYFRGHDLYQETSDEYFGLLTAFPVFSIQRHMRWIHNWKDLIVSSYISNAPQPKVKNPSPASSSQVNQRKQPSGQPPLPLPPSSLQIIEPLPALPLGSR
jgi:hypothetical protein